LTSSSFTLNSQKKKKTGKELFKKEIKNNQGVGNLGDTWALDYRGDHFVKQLDYELEYSIA